jgi:hypothetical protein
MAKIFKNVSRFVLHIEKTVQTLLKTYLKSIKWVFVEVAF